MELQRVGVEVYGEGGSVGELKRAAGQAIGWAWGRLMRLDGRYVKGQMEGMVSKQMQQQQQQQQNKMQQLQQQHQQPTLVGGGKASGVVGSVGLNDHTIYDNMVLSTTSEGVGYVVQPFGCAPLHPAM